MSERIESVYKENYLLNRLFVLLTSVHSSPSFNSSWSGLCLRQRVTAHFYHYPPITILRYNHYIQQWAAAQFQCSSKLSEIGTYLPKGWSAQYVFSPSISKEKPLWTQSWRGWQGFISPPFLRLAEKVSFLWSTWILSAYKKLMLAKHSFPQQGLLYAS